MYRQARTKRDERGTAVVEIAMVLPLAFAMLLGIFTGGHAYFQKISLTDAAREGARYGASLKLTPTGINEWRQAVKSRVVAISGAQVTASQVCAELVKPTGSDTTCGVADPQGAASDPTSLTPASVVKVSISKAAHVDFVFFSTSPTLTSKVAARYERDIL